MSSKKPLKVLVIGSEGNMGRRYTAILEHLGHEVLKHDTSFSPDGYENVVSVAHKIIIATPTATHLNQIYKAREFTKADILCEKPIANHSISTHKFENVYMVNQYAYVELKNRTLLNTTIYDYYHSGTDGRYWDCIQLIHLAKGGLDIEGNSPIWSCAINGTMIMKTQVDPSYVAMVKDFLGRQNKCWNWKDTQLAHEKVLDALEKRHNNISNRDTSKNELDPVPW